MATIANLALLNAAGIATTFEPASNSFGKESVWKDRSREKFQSQAVLANKPGVNVRRVSGKVVMPILDTTTGALLYTMTGTIEFILPNASLEADRKGLRTRLGSLIGTAAMVDAVEDDIMPW